jgi:hypothetical protein
LKDWKVQAKAIKAVKGSNILHNIVSAAHFQKRCEWELLWVDPPSDDQGADLDVENIAFFDAYYSPIRELIAAQSRTRVTPDASVAYVETLRAFVGLHREVEEALRRRDDGAILAFAKPEKSRIWDALGRLNTISGLAEKTAKLLPALESFLGGL